MTCGWVVPILLPHPTDENRLLRTANCYAGRDFFDTLGHSADQGASWTVLFRPQSIRNSSDPQYAFPTNLVGGAGIAPGRYYLSTRRDSRIGGGSSIFRSDDDGQSWTEIFASRPANEPNGEIIRVGGLAYDLGRPDTIYAGLNVYDGSRGSGPPTPLRAGVMVSQDGGASWSPIGRQDLPEIFDLKLGIDGRNLYLGDMEDLRRLRLS